MASCIECEAEIEIEEPELGDIVICPECGIEMEIISVRPLELDLYEEEDEEDEAPADEEESDWSE